MNKKQLNELIYDFKNYSKKIEEISSELLESIRKPNFPEHISENIARFVLYNIYGIFPTRITGFGDLQLLNSIIEVKTFSSEGPISFGPTEKWDFLFLIDATRFMEDYYIVYLCEYSNKSEEFSNLQFNSKQKFSDICSLGKRPRISPKTLISQLYIIGLTIIFEGNFKKILETI